jgi:hypothetical protein
MCHKAMTMRRAQAMEEDKVDGMVLMDLWTLHLLWIVLVLDVC